VGAFADLLNELDADDRIKGRQFEHICKWFLMNDPVYKHELRRVWLWNEWPGKWGIDAGIDLVAEDRQGQMWAIQAKAYNPAYRVTKRDVNKFLAESGREVFTYRMLIATTNLIDRIGERTIQDQEKRVTLFRLNDLQASDVDWPRSPNDLQPVRPRAPARPREYQREAISKVLNGFESAERGQLIMACGTGKTLTALFINEQLGAARTLVLVPSLSLLKQTLNVWRANCANEFASLPVCSDDTVAKADDDIAVAHTSDVGVPVTTDPEEIAAFLRHGSNPGVVFATYQSSPQITSAFTLGKVPAFDLVIADEAHRCAGPVSSEFATVLDPRKIKAKRRLFMTATPRYFTGRVLKAAKEAEFEYASMDDEAKFGKVFHRLGFGEAIQRDLLTDYRVAIVGVDNATYLEWARNRVLVTRDGVEVTDAGTLAGQIGLAKAMREYGLRRVISFHSRVKRAREFAASMPDVVAWMPDDQRPTGELWSRYASGEMPAGERYVLLRHLGRLDSGERGLLANARCLAEGVDVPALDGVAFVDPRRSEVDIVQAVGRAIRKSKDKVIGTIIIPVFIEDIENPSAALDSSVFKPVWDVIRALRSHDDELGRQLDELRRELGRGSVRPRLPAKIHLDIPTRLDADFARAFDVRLVEQTTALWEYWFGLLEKYAEEFGHARPPQGYAVADYNLGDWVQTQRTNYAKGVLSVDRQICLQSLPRWSWNVREDRWEEGYQLLSRHVEQSGDATVPALYEVDGFKLGLWCVGQRTRYTDGTLEAGRQERLEQLAGWRWNILDEQWENGYRKAREYCDSGGDAAIPADFVTEDGFKLGGWAANQRAKFAKGTLEVDQVQRLDALTGWSWNPHGDQWEEFYRRFAHYVGNFGSTRIGASLVVDDYNVGAWANRQRNAYAKGRLSPERQKRLEALSGWAWDALADKWNEGYERTAAYAVEYRTARVPFSFKADDGYALGSWVNTQRVAYAQGKLSPDRQRRLESIEGWVWRTRPPNRAPGKSQN
jgi:superfamily II DNA or RNA helicase